MMPVAQTEREGGNGDVDDDSLPLLDTNNI